MPSSYTNVLYGLRLQAFIRWAGHNKSILDDSNTEVQAKEKDVEREEQWYSNDFRELGGKREYT